MSGRSCKVPGRQSCSGRSLQATGNSHVWEVVQGARQAVMCWKVAGNSHVGKVVQGSMQAVMSGRSHQVAGCSHVGKVVQGTRQVML